MRINFNKNCKLNKDRKFVFSQFYTYPAFVLNRVSSIVLIISDYLMRRDCYFCHMRNGEKEITYRK